MKKIIIANWKMELSYQASIVLARRLAAQVKAVKHEVVVCPDYLPLAMMASIFKKTKIKLGAQDSAGDNFGAYTGEVSARNLRTLGVKYVILGHSERRGHYHENSAIINQKIKAALKNNLIPILCVGEKAPERAAGQAVSFITDELRRALKGVQIKNATSLIIAYEPVWVIGNNQAIDPAEASAMHQVISQQASKILKKTIAIIYGGSVNIQNAPDFLHQPFINGLLVGTASRRLVEFQKIINS